MLDILIIFACLTTNAFFSAYEMAFVTVSREEMDELQEKPRSFFKRLSAFKSKPERTLSAIQIGITFVGAVAAAVGGTGAVDSLEPYMVERFEISKSVAEAIAVTIIILPLTYSTVVFGELLPKTIALRHPKRILLFGTNALSFIDKFLSPIVSLLEVSTNFFLKLFGLTGSSTEDESMGQMVEIGNLPDYHRDFVQNLISLKGQKVSKAMIPWNKAAILSFSDSKAKVKKMMSGTPYSRYPVIDSGVLVGILLRKEFLESLHQAELPWQGIIRAAVKVSDTQKVLEAFLEMQEKQIPLAVVENADGKFVGIITVEDIVEEIVGDIHDRTDHSLASKVLSNRPKIILKK